MMRNNKVIDRNHINLKTKEKKWHKKEILIWHPNKKKPSKRLYFGSRVLKFLINKSEDFKYLLNDFKFWKFNFFRIILIIFFFILLIVYIQFYLLNFIYEENINYKRNNDQNINLKGNNLKVLFQINNQNENFIKLKNCLIINNNLNNNDLNLEFINYFDNFECELTMGFNQLNNLNLNVNSSNLVLNDLNIAKLNFTNKNTHSSIKNSKFKEVYINGINSNIYFDKSEISYSSINIISGYFNFINYDNLKLNYNSFNKNLSIRGNLNKKLYSCNNLSNENKIKNNLTFLDILIDENLNNFDCKGNFEDGTNFSNQINLTNYYGYSIFYKNNLDNLDNFNPNSNRNFFEFPYYFRDILTEKFQLSQNKSILPLQITFNIIKNDEIFNNLFENLILIENNFYNFQIKFFSYILSEFFIKKSTIDLSLNLKPNYYLQNDTKTILNINFLIEWKSFLNSLNIKDKIYFKIPKKNFDKLLSFINSSKNKIENSNFISNYIKDIKTEHILLNPYFLSNGNLFFETYNFTLDNLNIKILYFVSLVLIIIINVIIFLKWFIYNINFIKLRFKKKFSENYNYIKFSNKKYFDQKLESFNLKYYSNLIDHEGFYFFNIIFLLSLYINRIIYSKMNSFKEFIKLIYKKKNYESEYVKNNNIKIEFNEFNNSYEKFCFTFNFRFINYDKNHLNKKLKKINYKIEENIQNYIITNIIIKKDIIENIFFYEDNIYNNLKFFIDNICFKTIFEQDIITIKEFKNYYSKFCKLNNLKEEFFDYLILRKKYNFNIKWNKEIDIKINNKYNNKYFYLLDNKKFEKLNNIYSKLFFNKNNSKLSRDKLYNKIKNNIFYHEFKKLIILIIFIFIYFNITMYTMLSFISLKNFTNNNFYSDFNFYINGVFSIKIFLNYLFLINSNFEKILITIILYFLALFFTLNIYFYDNFYFNLNKIIITKQNKFSKVVKNLNTILMLASLIFNFSYFTLYWLFILILFFFDNIILNSFFLLIFGSLISLIRFKIYFNNLIKLNKIQKLKSFEKLLNKKINKSYLNIKYIEDNKKEENNKLKNKSKNNIYNLLKNNLEIPKIIIKLIKYIELNEIETIKNILIEVNQWPNFEINNSLIDLIELIINQKTENNNFKYLEEKILNIFLNLDSNLENIINDIIKKEKNEIKNEVKSEEKVNYNNNLSSQNILKEFLNLDLSENKGNKNNFYKTSITYIIIIIERLKNGKLNEVKELIEKQIFNKLNYINNFNNWFWFIKIINLFYFNKNKLKKNNIIFYNKFYKILNKSLNIENNSLNFITFLFSNNNNNPINLIDYDKNKFDNSLWLLFPENYFQKIINNSNLFKFKSELNININNNINKNNFNFNFFDFIKLKINEKTFNQMITFINEYKIYCNKNNFDIINNIKENGIFLNINYNKTIFFLFLKSIKNIDQNNLFEYILKEINNNIFINKILKKINMNLNEFYGFILMINKIIYYEEIFSFIKLICKRNDLNEYQQFLTNIIILIFSNDDIENQNSFKELNLKYYKIFVYLKTDKYLNKIDELVDKLMQNLLIEKIYFKKIKKELILIIKNKNIKLFEDLLNRYNLNKELMEVKKYYKTNDILFIYFYMIIQNENSTTEEIMQILKLIFIELEDEKFYKFSFKIIYFMKKINKNYKNILDYSINSLIKNILNDNSKEIDYILDLLLDDENKIKFEKINKLLDIKYKNKNIITHLNFINNSINLFHNNIEFYNILKQLLNNNKKNNDDNYLKLLLLKKIMIPSLKLNLDDINNLMITLISKIFGNEEITKNPLKFVNFLFSLFYVILDKNYKYLANYFKKEHQENFLKYLINIIYIKKDVERINLFYSENNPQSLSKIELFGFFTFYIQNKININNSKYLNIFCKKFNIKIEVLNFINFYLNPNQNNLLNLINEIKEKYEFRYNKNYKDLNRDELWREFLENLLKIINKESFSLNSFSKILNIENNDVSFIYNLNKLKNKKKFQENIFKDKQFSDYLKLLNIQHNEFNFFFKLNLNIINLKEILLFIDKIEIKDFIDDGILINLLLLNNKNYHYKKEIDEVYELSLNFNYIFNSINIDKNYIWMVLFSLKGDIENFKKCIKKLLLNYYFIDNELFKFFINIISIKNCSKLYFKIYKISFKKYNNKLKDFIQECISRSNNKILNYKETYIFHINKYLNINIIHFHLFKIMDSNYRSYYNLNDNLTSLLNQLKLNVFDYIIIKNIINSDINMLYFLNDFFYLISLKNYFKIEINENENEQYKKYFDIINKEIENIYKLYLEEFKILVFSKKFVLLIEIDDFFLNKLSLIKSEKKKNYKDEINFIFLKKWNWDINNKIISSNFKDIISFYFQNNSYNLIEDLIYKNELKYKKDYNLELFKKEFIAELIDFLGISLSYLEMNINQYYVNIEKNKNVNDLDILNIFNFKSVLSDNYNLYINKGWLLGIKFIFLKLNSNLENVKNNEYLYKKQNEKNIFLNQRLLFDIIQKLLIYKIDIRYYKDDLFFNLYMLFNGYFFSNNLIYNKNPFIINYLNIEKINKKLDEIKDVIFFENESNNFKVNLLIFYYLFKKNLNENLKIHFHIDNDFYYFINDNDNKLFKIKMNYQDNDEELKYLLSLENNDLKNELIKMRLGFNNLNLNFDNYMNLYKMIDKFKLHMEYINDCLILDYDLNIIINKFENNLNFIKFIYIYKSILQLMNIKKLNSKEIKYHFNNISFILKSNINNLINIFTFIYNENSEENFKNFCKSINLKNKNLINIFFLEKFDTKKKLEFFHKFFENLSFDNNLVYIFKYLVLIYSESLKNNNTKILNNLDFENILQYILNINKNYNQDQLVSLLFKIIHNNDIDEKENLYIDLYQEFLKLINEKINEEEKIEYANYLKCLNKLIVKNEWDDCFNNYDYEIIIKKYLKIKNKNLIYIYKILEYYESDNINGEADLEDFFYEFINYGNFNFYGTKNNLDRIKNLLIFLKDFKNSNINSILKFLKEINLVNEYTFILSNYIYISIINNWIDESKLNNKKIINSISIIIIFNFLTYFFHILKINNEFNYKSIKNINQAYEKINYDILKLDYVKILDVIQNDNLNNKNYINNKKKINYMKKFEIFMPHINYILIHQIFPFLNKEYPNIKKNLIIFLNYYLYKKEFYFCENNKKNVIFEDWFETIKYNNKLFKTYENLSEIDNDPKFIDIINKNQEILNKNSIVLDNYYIILIFKIIFFNRNINRKLALNLNENKFIKSYVNNNLKNLCFELNKNINFKSNNDKLYLTLINYINTIENMDLENKKKEFFNNLFAVFYNIINIENNENILTNNFDELNILNKDFDLIFYFCNILIKYWNKEININFLIYLVNKIFIEFNFNMKLFNNFKYFLLLIKKEISYIDFLYKKKIINFYKKEYWNKIYKSYYNDNNNNQINNILINNKTIFNIRKVNEDEYLKLIYILKDLINTENKVLLENEYEILNILFKRIKLNISNQRIYQILSLNNEEKSKNIEENIDEFIYNFLKLNFENLNYIIKTNKLLFNYSLENILSVIFILIIFSKWFFIYVLKNYFELFWEGYPLYPFIINIYTVMYLTSIYLFIDWKVNFYSKNDVENNLSIFQ